MLKKLILGAAAALTATIAMPASAEAQGYGYYDGYQSRGYYRDGPRRYRPGDYFEGYGRRADRRYARRGYYADRGYYGDRGYYRGRGRYRCGDGTTGAIVGGAAGALVGREIARDGRGYGRYGRYGSRRGGGGGSAGALIGGAIGALVGRELDRDC